MHAHTDISFAKSFFPSLITYTFLTFLLDSSLAFFFSLALMDIYEVSVFCSVPSTFFLFIPVVSTNYLSEVTKSVSLDLNF
jgi:hypothetical protein